MKTNSIPQKIQTIVNNSANWQEALDKLKGYDLIFSVSAVKFRFSVTDNDILAWINGEIK